MIQKNKLVVNLVIINDTEISGHQTTFLFLLLIDYKKKCF